MNKDFSQIGSLAESFEVLLSFRQADLLSHQELFGALFEIHLLFSQTIASLSSLV